MRKLIGDLVAHHVAVTSTLPVFDASTVNEPPSPRVTPETNARTTARAW